MILIVDDNLDNIFSLKTLLTLHQFEVDSATSGEEALKKIVQHSYALVVLDVQMPDMDGFEVAEAMSGYSKSKDIPIIFLSAVNIHKKFVTKGYTSGGIDYITKPFDPDILLLKIKTFYRLSQQTQQLNAMEKNLRDEIALRKEAEVILEKKVEERTAALKISNQQLQDRNKDLQQFAFIASHDLQEPLRKIQTFSNIILERHLDEKPKVKYYLDKISSSAIRLRGLVTGLLNLSNIDSEDAFEKTNLSTIVEETLADLELTIKAQQATIDVSPLAEIEVIRSQFHRVFQNLIDNSLKFCRENVPCKVTIKGEYVAEKAVDAACVASGEFYRISICDNGIGFSSEFTDRIFEIFRRLNNRDKYEGHGIGLAIVKKIVDRHEGLLYARGKENEGATFIIVLPVKHRKRFSDE
jgi:signal transduction histidine kinase